MVMEWIRSKLRAPEPESGDLLRQAESAYREGELEQARRYCETVLRRSQSSVRALSLLASIAADRREIDQGMQWAKRAMAADPGAGLPHYAMGRLWEAAGRYVEAESSYRTAVGFDPKHAKAHNNLGAVLHMQGKLDAALDCYRRALELDPALPEANQNYAAIARDPGAQELAIQGYLRQTAANPNDAVAFHNLASLYEQAGRYREALASFERAIALDPHRAEAHFGKAQLLLLCGDYAEGWKEYEWRWRIDAFNSPARRFPQPMWNGESIDGTVLVHGETGLGDMLQFVRYAPLLARRCAAVAVECPPPLKSLVQGVGGVSQAVAQGETLPPFAAHVPLIRFPFVFGTTLDTIPWQGPYIGADPERIAEWRARVETGDEARLKVGLVWAGNPRHVADRQRSITLDALSPLAQATGVRFYSLQKGGPAREAGSAPAGMDLVDLTAHIRDFSDTAALVSRLDLVVAVDTAVAHLAGAMGVPVWVLLAYSPEWRNLLERSDNPWYPSMRLFRQERDGDWAGVIDRVARELLQRAGSIKAR